MSKLSESGVLTRLREIKKLLHDQKIQSAKIQLDKMIKEMTNSAYICTRCGCQISIEDCHMAGDYCESCFRGEQS